MVFLKSHDLKVLNANLNIFVKLDLIIVVYIDNLQITKSFFSKIQVMKNILNKQFYMSDLGLYQYFLGIIIIWNRKNWVLKLSQQVYLEKTFYNLKITKYKVISILIQI